MSHYESGLNGEALAEERLTAEGMTCLDRRWRGGGGEIDLVMEDGGTVVFVEVKYRPASAAGSGLMAITPAKQRRLLGAAMSWLMEHGGLDRACRFDAVEITAGGYRHIKDAFRPG